MFILKMWYDNGPEYSEDAVFFGPFSKEENAETAFSKRVREYCLENDCSGLNWKKNVFILNAADVALEMAEGELV